MAKYPGYLTTMEVCDNECEEAAEIMKRYNVPPDEMKRIFKIIENVYFMMKTAFIYGRATENVIHRYFHGEETKILNMVLSENYRLIKEDDDFYNYNEE